MDSIFHFFTDIKDGLILIVMFGMAIFIHELGHFLVALRCGMIIETFSIGFGPSIVEWKRNGITYKLGWIPLGGYVSLPQIDPTGMRMIQGQSEAAASSDTSDNKNAKPLPYISPWARILVSVAGAGGNLVLAVVLAIIISRLPAGQSSHKGPLLIAVEPNSAAYTAGLRTGQELLAVNQHPIKSWYDFKVECVLPKSEQVTLSVRDESGSSQIPVTLSKSTSELDNRSIQGLDEASGCMVMEIRGEPALSAGIKPGDIIVSLDGTAIVSHSQFQQLVGQHADKPAALVVSRMGKHVPLTVTPKLDEKLQRAIIGVAIDSVQTPTPFWMDNRGVWQQLRADAAPIFRILQALVTPSESKQAAQNLGGMPTIALTLWTAIQSNIWNAVGFLRFLCVDLAILNLLPIPLLDGGHVMFCLWEGITRRRVPPKVANILVNTCGGLLLAALLFINLRDCVRIPRILRLIHTAQAARDAAPAPTTAPSAAVPKP